LIVSGIAFVVLFVLAITMPVPYSILTPGPTYNTLGKDNFGATIIVIKGTATKPTTGNLNMTTVYVTGKDQKETAWDVLNAWVSSDQTVVPKSSVYLPGQSTKQVNQQNTADFLGSQDHAIAAASCELGYPKGIAVQSFTSGSKASKILKVGDRFDTLNGQDASSVDKLHALLQKESPGQTVNAGVERDGKPLSLSIVLGKPNAGATGASIGISIVAGCIPPFQVDLGLGNQIGGPSAGMMFALGIIDKVGTVDLTHGRFIAGTGEIDPAGNVGAIGGIQLKMIAARRAGATVFLAPASNCSDVRGHIPSGLEVIKVDTLHHAVADLEALNAGQAVPHC
jgi:PDZ domain-containing protein